MAVPTDPSELAENARCYCFSPELARAVKIYLLAQIAGLGAMTNQELAEAAKCYCFDSYTAMKVELYLENVIANA